MSKYVIEIELPDNETIKECIKTDEVHWSWHGYSGYSKAISLDIEKGEKE